MSGQYFSENETQRNDESESNRGKLLSPQHIITLLISLPEDIMEVKTTNAFNRHKRCREESLGTVYGWSGCSAWLR